jgi:hypothetical protein
MIKINKQLQRPDGGNVSTGSIIDYNSRFIGKGRIVSFDLMHHFSESALNEGKQLIPSITNFIYRLNKECTIEEWTELMIGADASGDLVQNWLKKLIDVKIGSGYTEII